jgi:hypothetical protein
MTLRYVRVKDLRTRHQFDVLEEQVDPEIHKVLDQERYPIVSRPRDPKPHVSKGGGPATAPTEATHELNLKNTRPELVDAAEAAGIDPTDLTKPQILAALAAPKTSTE